MRGRIRVRVRAVRSRVRVRANPNSPNPNPNPDLSQVPSMRIAPFCRLVHLATMDFVFKVLVLIPPVIPPFATIFVIYVGAYTLVAWVMCLLLDDMDVPLGRCEAQARTEAGASDPAAYAEAVEELSLIHI